MSELSQNLNKGTKLPRLHNLLQQTVLPAVWASSWYELHFHYINEVNRADSNLKGRHHADLMTTSGKHLAKYIWTATCNYIFLHKTYPDSSEELLETLTISLILLDFVLCHFLSSKLDYLQAKKASNRKEVREYHLR